jgi:hypothetical protein
MFHKGKYVYFVNFLAGSSSSYLFFYLRPDSYYLNLASHMVSHLILRIKLNAHHMYIQEQYCHTHRQIK